ncbi:hypothetical protein [Peterkaempfera griseoplana]|nr:hypothetical protein [Peterkaempfera griseoplana]
MSMLLLLVDRLSAADAAGDDDAAESAVNAFGLLLGRVGQPVS